eukprot:TRINITY_DN2561_c0_g1_i1.p1 TRINITY_DN2561_c0_g1~~TRINITY_DN2561_c0_g1_i1.p1  ORF type:complete len:449 (+),score=83.54 TRINITY_DN2561_c0_g1_i1:43-1389(+)
MKTVSTLIAALVASSNADVVKSGPQELLYSGDTYIYTAPHDTTGAANIPFTNMTVVSYSKKLNTIPEGYSAINIDAHLPKYLVRSHPGSDQTTLKKAYGNDAVQVGPEHFILATSEVLERKAHSCGSLVLNPVTGDDVRRSEMRIPEVSPSTSSMDVKSDYMSEITDKNMESILRMLSGEDPIEVDGSTTKLLTRYSFVDQNRQAAEWAGSWLIEHAACDDVEYQTFTVSGQLTRNVICKKIGKTEPSEIVVVGAHFDSISSANGGDSATFAPGAIDNGSGSATVMAVANALKEHQNGKTIHFILFSGEEQGLYGSTHYVSVAQQEGLKIRCALILDMTAYSNRYFGVIIEGTNDAAIKQLMENADTNLQYLSSTLGSSLSIQHNHRSFGSDHVPFQRAGIPAILHIERDDTNYPGYHRTTDTVAYANFDQMRDIGRVMLGQVMDYSA